jgi:hypothetical protein
MPTIKLEQDRAYRGKVFRAGNAVEVPEAFASLLAVEERNRARAGEQELRRRYGEELGRRLQQAGFVDAAAVAGATDEQILAVEGVGPATLRRIRGA